MVKKKSKEKLSEKQLQGLKKIAAILSGNFRIGKDKTIWTMKKKPG